MNFDQKPVQSLKQLQRLIMSPEMQQAIHLMQMPIMELSQVVETELEHNPVLEYDEIELQDEEQETSTTEVSSEKELDFNDRDLEILKRLDEDFRSHFCESENYYTKRTADEEQLKTYQEQSIKSQESLFEHLMKQAKDVFNEAEDYRLAELLIGNFDENGFLNTPLNEMAPLNNCLESDLERVLRKIQGFDPFGVAGRNLRESFLIQLRCRKEEKSLAYEIIEKNFDDLLHNRMPHIMNSLNCSSEELKKAIHHKIAKLDWHPGAIFSKELIRTIIPDVKVRQEGDKLEIIINEDSLPIIRLNSKYVKMLDDPRLPKETKDFIRNKLISAKWLLKNIDQRHETLFRVVETIISKQKKFFTEAEGALQPLTLKEVGEELELHESTIARAVANKYMDTPKGILKLKYFFSNTYTTTEGESISSKAVRDILKKFIEKENKKRPLSDDALSKLLEKKGIPCARRTVAKYRSEMKIGNTQQRKEY